MKKVEEIPKRIQSEEALLGRLPKNHPKYIKIKNSIEKRRAGYRGECNVDYHLSFLQKSKYIILKDLNLQYDEKRFQIDRLLLSPYFLLDLEIKNYSGSLFFDTKSKQLIQKYNEIEKGYPNPLQQAERQLSQLGSWLRDRRLPNTPLDYLIAISYPKTILKSNSDAIFRKVLHAEHLVNKIVELEAHYKKPLFEDKTLRKIKKQLLKENTPPNLSILEVWDIDPSEILLGVQCPRCSLLPMKRLFGEWLCLNCNTISKNAHLKAIEDYFLIMKPTITNKECRSFLRIESRRTAERILKSLNVAPVGNKKGTFYIKS